MQRKSVYPYTQTEPPGVNVHRLRQDRELSLRQLADRCHPPLDHSTVARLEQNGGFTSDTLERVAAALGVKPGELWLPPELIEYATLPEEGKRRVVEYLRDLAAVYHYRGTATG